MILNRCICTSLLIAYSVVCVYGNETFIKKCRFYEPIRLNVCHPQILLIGSCVCLPTGFSFGGLLACSIAAQIWLSRYLSYRLLQDNLVCITFAQPHIPVPQLAAVARECPEIASTIHAIYNKEDPVPQLMALLNLPISSIVEKKRRKPPPVRHLMMDLLALY